MLWQHHHESTCPMHFNSKNMSLAYNTSVVASSCIDAKQEVDAKVQMVLIACVAHIKQYLTWLPSSCTYWKLSGLIDSALESCVCWHSGAASFPVKESAQETVAMPVAYRTILKKQCLLWYHDWRQEGRSPSTCTACTWESIPHILTCRKDLAFTSAIEKGPSSDDEPRMCIYITVQVVQFPLPYIWDGKHEAVKGHHTQVCRRQHVIWFGNKRIILSAAITTEVIRLILTHLRWHQIL